jgi:hypothetical protein
MSSELNQIQRGAQIVGQDAHETITVARGAGAKAADNLSNSLVDGLVEAGDFMDVLIFAAGCRLCPQAQNARTQCTIFSDGVLKVEAGIEPHPCMRGCYAVKRITAGTSAQAFFDLLIRRLQILHVVRDHFQDVSEMVTQYGDAKNSRRGCQGCRKCLPLAFDFSGALSYELDKPHGQISPTLSIVFLVSGPIEGNGYQVR